jgi:pimeloyl-ACP methyl ester carboxylesterase
MYTSSIGLRIAIALSLAPALAAQTPRSTFVSVEKDITLEVLDWGGAGVPVVLLAGRNQTAHSFERFAPSLAAHYRVYAITRRGSGASSKPATGYLADRLADDVLAVVDSLHLIKPVLAGHSLAGQELSSIGSRHSDKVAGLVYLDAAQPYAIYDTTRGAFSTDVAVLKQRLERLQRAANRGDVATMDTVFTALLNQDLPALERDLTQMRSTLGQFAAGTPLMPPVRVGIEAAIDDGLQRFTTVHGPVLAISRLDNAPAGVGVDRQTTKQWLQRDRGNLGTFARLVPQAEMVVLPNASHFVFDSNPAEVLAAMRAFIDKLPRR